MEVVAVNAAVNNPRNQGPELLQPAAWDSGGRLRLPRRNRDLKFRRRPLEVALMPRRVVRSTFQFLKAENGPTAVEYAVMLALVIVVCIGAVTTLGSKSRGTFTTTGAVLPSGS